MDNNCRLIGTSPKNVHKQLVNGSGHPGQGTSDLLDDDGI